MRSRCMSQPLNSAVFGAGLFCSRQPRSPCMRQKRLIALWSGQASAGTMVSALMYQGRSTVTRSCMRNMSSKMRRWLIASPMYRAGTSWMRSQAFASSSPVGRRSARSSSVSSGSSSLSSLNPSTAAISAEAGGAASSPGSRTSRTRMIGTESPMVSKSSASRQGVVSVLGGAEAMDSATLIDVVLPGSAPPTSKSCSCGNCCTMARLTSSK